MIISSTIRKKFNFDFEEKAAVNLIISYTKTRCKVAEYMILTVVAFVVVVKIKIEIIPRQKKFKRKLSLLRLF